MTAVTAPECRTWLAAARERACLSQAQLGERLGVTEKTIRRWERGESLPAIPKRADMARVLGYTVDELNRQLGLDVAPAPAGLDGNGAFSSAPEWLPLYVRAETSSARILTLEVTTLPALAQTGPYVRAVEAAGHRVLAEGETDGFVAARIDRASVIATAEYVALVPSWLLHTTVGSARVMSGQFAHLLALADRPNVTVLVIGPEHLAAVQAPFTLLGTVSAEIDTVVDATPGEPVVTHSRAVVRDRLAVFEHLRSLALSPEASREAIAKSAGRFAALAASATTKGTA